MIPYILHVTVITTICFLFYKFLLQKETFYHLNRWMLMACLAVSFTLPLLPAPPAWSWQAKVTSSETVTLTPAPKVVVQNVSVNPGTVVKQEVLAFVKKEVHRRIIRKEKPATGKNVLQAKPKAGEAVDAQQITTNVNSGAAPPVTATPPAKAAPPATGALPVTAAGADYGSSADHQPATPEKKTVFTAIPILSQAGHWIFYCYLFGVLLFGVNFLLQLAVLLYQSYANPFIQDGRFRIVETSGNRAPCSFGNTIFINPANYDWDTYNQILIHEKTHVSGRHTVDILLAELAVVLQWFNPVAWLYRREVENNLEFLTDASVLSHQEVERSAYQLSLLRVSAPHLPFSLTNNYNQSLLKRRIVMMNSKRSSRHTVWKYFFLLPVLTGLVCALNKPAAFGQKAKASAASQSAQSIQSAQSAAASQSAAATQSVQPAQPAQSAGKADRAVPVTPVWRDTTARPASTSGVAAEGSGSTGGIRQPAVQAVVANVQVMTTGAMASPQLIIEPSPLLSVQSTVQPLPAINVNLSSLNVSVADLTDGSWFVTTTDNKLHFELKAEDEENSWSHTLWVEKSEINPFPGVGTVEFKLVREAGTMSFTGQFDGQQGFGHFHFKGDESFFNALQQQGVEEIDQRRKVSFFLCNVKRDYVNMVLHNGYPHISGRELLSLASMHIDRAYMEELKAAGYDHLTTRQLFSFRSQHIDGRYIRSLGRGADNTPVPAEEIISYKAIRIDSGYLASLRQVGYGQLDRRELTSLYSLHVSADFIKGFQDLGCKDIPVRDLLSLKSMGITPEFVKGFRNVGFNQLSPREMSQFKSMKITPEFIKGFQVIGYEDLSASRLSSLRSMGITPEFVSEFKKIGFENIPVSMLPSLKAMGVNAEYVSKMREKGFVSKDLNKYMRLKNDFN